MLKSHEKKNAKIIFRCSKIFIHQTSNNKVSFLSATFDPKKSQQ